MSSCCIPFSCWITAGIPSKAGAEKPDATTSRLLRELIAHAYRHSPYYRELFDERGIDWQSIREPADLARLPLLNKATLAAQMSRFPRPDASPGRLRVRRTTGTSGTPLELPVSPEEKTFDLYAWQRVYMQAGLRIHHRQVKFIIPSAAFPKHSLLSALGLFRREYFSTMEPPAAKADYLEKIAPQAVFGHASILGEIARELERCGKKLRVPLIFSTSDMLWPGLRAQISDRLQGEIFDLYGAVETGPVAWECRAHDGFHINRGLVIVELVDDQGLPAPRGHVVCTVLWRKTVPLIRYVLGDLAEWATTPCPCGNAGPRLAALHGREHELFKLPDGGWVSASNLVSVFVGVPGVRHFQVVQQSERRFEYRIVPGPDYAPDSDTVILEHFRGRFGRGIEATVSHVTHIDQLPGSKFTPFISLARQTARKSS